MSDRELLELAAKAAGIELVWHNFSNVPSLFKGLSSDEVWNPLTDDGDALRLAVKLNLAVVFHPVLNQALCRPYHTRDLDSESREDAEKHADPYAATRRAIVRAAAEIEREWHEYPNTV